MFSSRSLKLLVQISLVWVLILIIACGGGGDSAAPAVPVSSFRAVVMGSGSIPSGGKVYTYKLLRLEVQGKAPAYAQWISQPGGQEVPVVMLTDPYGGIIWNGDHPPVVAEAIRTPERVFSDAYIYLRNGFSVLNVFGRFYAGGDIQNDVDDMVAGLRFLAQAPGVMRNRIGVSGGSWGGFESLYAAAHAPDAAVPIVGVALYPVSDFQAFMDYVTVFIPATVTDATKRAQYINFFAPYVERINAAAQGDYSRWTRDYLLSNLRTNFLVVHDQWDTLIPFNHSLNLVSLSGGRVQGVWLLKGSSANLNELPNGHGHGDLQSEDNTETPYSFPMYFTLSLGYLLKGIALPDQIITNVYDPDALYYFVMYLKIYKDFGVDMEWAAPRLLDLADDRVRLINMDNAADVRDGDAVVARVLNDIWGTTLDATNVRDALASGLPPY